MVDKPDITQEEARAAQPRIVEAVFASANVGGMARGQKSPLAKLIEKAMSEAVEYAYSHGITDPEQVRDLMQTARHTIKERYAKAVAEAASNLAG
jgi:ketopantoate reductase